MPQVNKQTLAYIKKNIPFDQSKYVLQKEVLPLARAIQLYEKNENVLCFLNLCTIKSSETSVMDQIYKKKNYTEQYMHSSLSGYFKLLIQRDSEWDDEIAQTLDDIQDQMEAIETPVDSSKLVHLSPKALKDMGIDFQQAALNVLISQNIEKLRSNCRTATNRYVAVVTDRFQGIINVENSLWSVIQEYSGPLKSKLPQSTHKLIDKYVNAVSVIILTKKGRMAGSGYTNSKSSKKDDTLPPYNRIEIKDNIGKESILYYSVQSQDIRFIIANPVRVVLGIIPPDKIENSNLAKALNLILNIQKNSPAIANPIVNTPKNETIKRSKIQLKEVVHGPLTQDGTMTSQNRQPDTKKKIEQLIGEFWKSQFKMLIMDKNAKQFNSEPIQNSEGKAANIVPGYTQTYKILIGNQQNSINFILNRLNFAINRLDKL